jgi:predicted Kef-type K+ transport protein
MKAMDIIIGLFLIFGLIVYMIAIPPVADYLIVVMAASYPAYASSQELAHKAAVLYIPIIYGFGILLWGFAAATREEGYYGVR